MDRESGGFAGSFGWKSGDKAFSILGFGPLEPPSLAPCRGQIKRRALLRRPAYSNMSVV